MTVTNRAGDPIGERNDLDEVGYDPELGAPGDHLRDHIDQAAAGRRNDAIRANLTLLIVPQIYGLLIEAKKRIGAVAKEGKFSAGDTSYNFRGVDQVTNACVAIFNDLGILGPTPEVEWSDHTVMEHQKSGSKGAYIQYAYRHLVRVRWTFIAAVDGSKHQVVTEGEAIDYSDKGTAKAQSVALRVALLQGLTLPTTDPDPDSIAPTIEKPSPSMTEEIVWNEEDNRKVREFLKAQSLQIQRSAKVFIRSQRIPLAKLQATDDQLDTIENFVRELLDEEVEREERIAEHRVTQGEYDNAAEGLDAAVAEAKANTAERLAGAGPDVVERRGGAS